MESYNVLKTMLDIEDVLSAKTLSIVMPVCKIIDDVLAENDGFQFEAEMVDGAILLKIIIPPEEELETWDTLVIRSIASYSDRIIIQTNEQNEVEVILRIEDK